jgi:hypothetical protein
MTDKHLQELAAEIRTSLQDTALDGEDRAVLQRLHSELQAVLGTPAQSTEPSLTLRDKLARAVEHLEGDHPRLTSLLSKSLDLLSDVGI